MKKKTPNAQRGTSNIEFKIGRVAEIGDGEYESKRNGVYDLEKRSRRADPDFRGQHSDGGEKRQMISAVFEFRVRRWTFGVRRFLH